MSSTSSINARVRFASIKAGGLALLAWVGLTTSARAAWSDIKAGLDHQAALKQVGVPLIQSHSPKRTLETWTYDDGAYIFFENGKVRYWQAPRAKKC